MKLPAVSDPHKYVGLYVFDFGDRASVGYTPAEVRLLREAPPYRDGTAYEIYGVHEAGGFELRGATDERLAATVAICRCHASGASARRDYDTIRRRAEEVPINAPVELHLARAYDFTPADVVALLFPVAAEGAVAAWLAPVPDHAASVEAGARAFGQYVQSSGMRVASCRLNAVVDYADRSLDVLLAHVHDECQR